MSKIVKQDISLYLNAIPDQFCERLIREFHKGFTLGEVVDGHVSHDSSDYRSDKFLKAKDIHMVDHERWDLYNAKLHRDFILPVLRDYLSSYKYVLAESSKLDPTSCIMSLYEKDEGFFCPHQDFLPESDRSLTIICYLNTVDYGGATRFFNQDFNISPLRGSIAVFPSNFVYGHVGERPISGDKYITVSFASVDLGDEHKAEALRSIDE